MEAKDRFHSMTHAHGFICKTHLHKTKADMKQLGEELLCQKLYANKNIFLIQNTTHTVYDEGNNCGLRLGYL